MELGCPGEIFNGQEDQKAFRREEFEGKLRDMGLELEKDEDVSFSRYLLQKWNVHLNEVIVFHLTLRSRNGKKCIFCVQTHISSLKNCS